MENRARRLVDCAIENKIPSPFAKANATDVGKRCKVIGDIRDDLILREVEDEPGEGTSLHDTAPVVIEQIEAKSLINAFDSRSKNNVYTRTPKLLRPGKFKCRRTLDFGGDDTDVEASSGKDFSPAESDDDYQPEKKKRTVSLLCSTKKRSRSSSSSSSTSSASSSSLNSSSSTQSRSLLLSNNIYGDNHQTNTNQDILMSIDGNCSADNTHHRPSEIEENEAFEVGDHQESPNKKLTRKRSRNVMTWKKVQAKERKNKGQQYISQRGKMFAAKEMKSPCTKKCKQKCSEQFTEEERHAIFKMYWDLSSFQRQRDFLNAAITVLDLKYRRLKIGTMKHKKPNTYCSLIKNGRSIRVCKTFFLNTLGIGDRILRSVIEARTSDEYLGSAPADKRGKHGKQRKVGEEVHESVRAHINSIARIESHYLRANTTREYIDGGLTVADLHRDYKRLRESKNEVAACYDYYFRVFNEEFNISFFVPKKDKCDMCEQYENANEEEKLKLLQIYKDHCEEKKLSRIEKKTDVETCRRTDQNKEIVAIYDLQAVMQVPLGNSSSFYYKSKLNCLNFTVTDVKDQQTYCYFWHEAMGARGAVEIGSCVFKYLQRISGKYPDCNVTFYSDNCCGQQKNRFILSMYLFAVKTLQINKITHKFLIRGHTQNEGDTAHSIIEKAIKQAKKSGAIYVPDQYVQIIRSAKKNGNPFIIEEQNFDDFYDLKKLADEIGLNLVKDVQENSIKLQDVKIVEFTKGSDRYRYKNKYADLEWQEAEIKRNNQRSIVKKNPRRKTADEVSFSRAYTSRREIGEGKKKDLKELMDKNIIPRFYSTFYNSIIL